MPLSLTSLGIFLVFSYRLTKKCHRDTQAVLWLSLLPPVGSLLFWFLTAPDIRFGGSCFLWILGAGTVTLAAGGIDRMKNGGRLCVILFSCFVLCQPVFIRGHRGFVKAMIKEKDFHKAFQELNKTNALVMTRPLNNGRYFDLPRVELMTFVTKSGLEIYTPTKRDQCWDAPLLCAPYPDADLRLREKGNMRRGFMVDENYPAIGIHR